MDIYKNIRESTLKVRIKPTHLKHEFLNWKTLYIWNVAVFLTRGRPPLFEDLIPLESCKEQFIERWDQFYKNPSGYDVILERNLFDWIVPSSVSLYEGKELDEVNHEACVTSATRSYYKVDLEEINAWVHNRPYIKPKCWFSCFFS
jgi:hypothetical protein